MDYWQKRHLDNKQASLARSNHYEGYVLAQSEETLVEIQAVLKKWLYKYAISGGVTVEDATKKLRGKDLAKWYQTLDNWEQLARDGGYENQLNLAYYRLQINRLQALEAETKFVMAKRTQQQSRTMGDVLANEFKQNYYRDVYEIQNQKAKYDSNFDKYTDAQFETFVQQRWHGQNFSERVWGNFVNELPRELTSAIRRGMLMGMSNENIIKHASSKFQAFEKYKQHRLIITEMSHAANEATYKAYQAEKIEKYRYLATLEIKTCAVCGQLDNKIFAVSDKKISVNYPPIHGHCRCTTVPVVKGEDHLSHQRWARDPKTGKGGYVPKQTYSQWAKLVGINIK
ncbi:hypothetical protein FE410_05330 [Leuconostoc carnosum]|uniref:minor capsid protein n=1 Tax=Leuconostoc TaxID=1243 RepID=UPI00123B0ED8|nr:minor capsid protein [Leuconostoc carnosum]KAA8371113.1 hypothetical protein FE414_05325 [Leuconostoc carnosum]KAA8382754.1 hypothetical protein FE410_05330 [Leuconostoc carnosum]